MPEEIFVEENESLLAKTLDYTTRSFLQICKTYPGKVIEGALGGIVGGVTAGMSYKASEGMMGLHAILGTAWGLGTLKAFSEGYQASINNDKNIKKAETEIEIFKKLMEVKGEPNSIEPIILAIDGALEAKGAKLDDKVKAQLRENPDENLKNLIGKASEVNSRNLLVAVSILGIVSTVVGFAVMEAYKNDLPETIFTAAAAATTSISSGLLNATTSSSADISENTYRALKIMNNLIHADLEISLAEKGEVGKLPNIEQIRRTPRTTPRNQSGTQVASNGVELGAVAQRL